MPLISMDGKTYVQDLASNVMAYDLATGTQLWRVDYNSPTVGPNGLAFEDGVLFGVTATDVFAIDAATALDWMQAYNADAGSCWIAGVSFGAWIAMQLLMRRPEVEGFISVAPPANLYDFTFLAPCPSSGLMVNGARDRVVPTESVRGLVDRLKTQKGIVIDHATVPEANHFFEGRMDGLMEVVDAYLDKRLGKKKKRESAA
jgi:dienelactone hydrolase